MELKELSNCLSAGEVSRRLGISVTRVSQLREGGKLSGIKTALGYLYRHGDVEAFKCARESRSQ